MLCYSLLTSFTFASWMSKGWTQYIFLLIMNVLIATNLLIISHDAASFYVDRKNGHTYLRTPIAFTFLLCFIIFLFGNNLAPRFLYPARFIESPNDAKWYLVQNPPQTDQSASRNGSYTTDLELMKKRFIPPNTTSHGNFRHNALYGYMAWNSGNTKIFCPPSAENTKLHEKQEQLFTDRCLVVDSQMLQPMPASYIGSDPNVFPNK